MSDLKRSGSFYLDMLLDMEEEKLSAAARVEKKFEKFDMDLSVGYDYDIRRKKHRVGFTFGVDF